MQPNKLGGQTFDECEVGIIRNALWQANSMLNHILEESANSGNSPAYNKLDGMFDVFGVQYASLCATVEEVEQKVKSLETEEFEANISESRVIMNCIEWITLPDALVQRNTTSVQQLEQARQMVVDFKGQPA